MMTHNQTYVFNKKIKERQKQTTMQIDVKTMDHLQDAIPTAIQEAI